MAEGPPYTLAVLPFVDLSETADNAYLAEELPGLLGRLPAQIDSAKLTALVNIVLICFGGSPDSRGLELMYDLDAEMARQDSQAPSCLTGHRPLARARAAVTLGDTDRALDLLREDGDHP